MVNSKILALFKEHNVNIEQGIAYLLCLYNNNKNIEWIPVETRSIIKLLGIVQISDNLPIFAYPLWENETTVKSTVVNINDNDILHFVTQTYLPLWPTNTQSIIGYSISGNTQDCVKRMAVFIKNFNLTFNSKYNKLEIFNLIKTATKSYLAHKKIENYHLCKKNNNFIADDKGSLLEEFINKTIKGELTEIDKLAAFTTEM